VAGEEAGAALAVAGGVHDLARLELELELELAWAAADHAEFPIPKEELGFEDQCCDMAATVTEN
jgi:hypothetical protein